MGVDLMFLQRDLNAQRHRILEKMAAELRKHKLAKKEPFKAMFEQLDELVIK